LVNFLKPIKNYEKRQTKFGKFFNFCCYQYTFIFFLLFLNIKNKERYVKKQTYSYTIMKRLSIVKQPALSVINDHLIDYPTPSNLNYMWSFGSLAGLCLMLQIATGIFLAMHYTPHVDLAFLSVEHIMRDVEGGWLLRYMHANGASMFFIVVYMHIFRNLYYGSYSTPRELVWCIGVIILLLMILTAFIGYVLPWGF